MNQPLCVLQHISDTKGYPEFQKALEELVRNKLNSDPADGGGLWTDQPVENLGIGPPLGRGQGSIPSMEKIDPERL